MKNRQREVFADLLRTIAIISVVFIHTTSNYLVESYGMGNSKIILVLSAFTSSAVPIFYMLSGCFLLDEKNSDYAKFYKKIIKVFLQTIFWSIIYLLMFKYIMGQDFNLFEMSIKSIFREQVSHLWYMYPLIGLYILTPFISKLYNSLTNQEKLIMLSIIMFIPILLGTIQIKFWDYIAIPKFAVFFPELGLFVLGRYIYENKEKLNSNRVRILAFDGIFIGIMLIVGLAYFYINKEGISYTKPYFDYNKAPNFLLDVSLFIFILSLDKKLINLSNGIKRTIHFIGSNSGGIYFVHMIYIYLFPYINILGLKFTANQGRLLHMILGTFLYFIMALITTVLIKKIPLLKKSV